MAENTDNSIIAPLIYNATPTHKYSIFIVNLQNAFVQLMWSRYRILARLGRFRRYAAFNIFKKILKIPIITPLSTLRRRHTNLVHGKCNHSQFLQAM